MPFPAAPDFVHKVIERLDRMDRIGVQNYIKALLNEKRLTDQILDQMNEGILLLDVEGVVKYANRQAFLWLGFERYIQDRTPVSKLIKEPEVLAFVERLLRHPEEPTSQEFNVLLPRPLTLRIYWTPLEIPGGERILVRIENITHESQRSEEEAKNSRIESLLRLAAGLAHEIGNPLNSVQIHLELLKREISALPRLKQKTLLHWLKIISSETKRLDQTVRSFLRTVRRRPLRLRRGSLNEVLEETVRFLSPEIKKTKVKVRLALDPNLPNFLLDRDRLHQASLNLIKNALEAMPRGGALTLSSSFKERLCFVRLEDEGMGISEGDLPHIFEAYYTTKKEGFGLGLTQVYQAVLEHGGRIDVKSQPGKGSVFTLILPIRQERLSLPQPQKEPKR